MSDWRKVKNAFLDGLVQAVEESGSKYREDRRLEVIQATWDRNGSRPVLVMVAVGQVGWWGLHKKTYDRIVSAAAKEPRRTYAVALLVNEKRGYLLSAAFLRARLPGWTVYIDGHGYEQYKLVERQVAACPKFGSSAECAALLAELASRPA